MAEDSEGLSPRMGLTGSVTGLTTDVMVNSVLALGLRGDMRFWNVGDMGRRNYEQGEASGLHDKI